MTGASDLALLGIAVTVACLGVLTAGSALATASVAVHYWCDNRGLPPTRELALRFWRGLLPGAVATLAFLAGIVALVTDLRAVAGGRVPGGAALLVVTVLIGGYAAGIGGLALVRLGAVGGRGWLAAVRWAGRAGLSAPALPLALAAVLAVGGLLCWLMPLISVVLPGVVVFGMHVVVRRSGSRPGLESGLGAGWPARRGQA